MGGVGWGLFLSTNSLTLKLLIKTVNQDKQFYTGINCNRTSESNKTNKKLIGIVRHKTLPLLYVKLNLGKDNSFNSKREKTPQNNKNIP